MSIKRLPGSATSIVTYTPSTGIVTKCIKNFKQYQREKYWLKYLNEKKYSWCPKLLNFNDAKQELYLEYIGPSLTAKNIPDDWKEQLNNILADLKKEGICHNDIKAKELLVRDDKLHLVDYGWVSLGTDWSCNGKFYKK